MREARIVNVLIAIKLAMVVVSNGCCGQVAVRTAQRLKAEIDHDVFLLTFRCLTNASDSS